VTPEHDSLFDSLLAGMTDGGITTDEQRQLGVLLQGNPERQRLYHDYLLNHLLLEQEGALQAASSCEQAASIPSAEPLERLALGGRPRRTGRDDSSIRSNRLGVRYAIAGMVLVLLTAGLTALFATHRGKSVKLATVVDAIGVDGAPHELTTEGAILDIGLPLQFSAGLVSVAMPSGAEFVIEGPASVVVRGPNRIQLDEGRLYAVVPSHATGFTVDSKTVSLVDLGTEFGVDVSPGGQLEAYVFLGRVRAESPEGAATLEAGRMITASSLGKLGPISKFDEADTSFTRSLDGTGYLSFIERLHPVYLHRFSLSTDRRQFQNDLGRSSFPVSLRGGVYAAAGGPIATADASDGYLRFVGVESVTAASSIQGPLQETNAYSFVAWVRVDAAGSQGLGAFAGPEGPEADLGFVLRVTSDGYLEHRCHRDSRSGYSLQRSEKPVPLGRWMQVVATGGADCDLNLYVNGERVAKPVRLTGAIRTDCGRLLLGSGSGRELANDLHTGPLRGAIDEVGVFDRRLSEEEISRLYSTSAVSNTPDLF
jgi:hypothetical protein